jgi:hypothetical protein
MNKKQHTPALAMNTCIGNFFFVYPFLSFPLLYEIDGKNFFFNDYICSYQIFFFLNKARVFLVRRALSTNKHHGPIFHFFKVF